MTEAKRLLGGHLEEGHQALLRRMTRTWQRTTMGDLMAAHKRSHHREQPDHYHEGVNLGPNARPRGWSTGEGAVRTR